MSIPSVASVMNSCQIVAGSFRRTPPGRPRRRASARAPSGWPADTRHEKAGGTYPRSHASVASWADFPVLPAAGRSPGGQPCPSRDRRPGRTRSSRRPAVRGPRCRRWRALGAGPGGPPRLGTSDAVDGRRLCTWAPRAASVAYADVISSGVTSDVPETDRAHRRREDAHPAGDLGDGLGSNLDRELREDAMFTGRPSRSRSTSSRRLVAPRSGQTPWLPSVSQTDRGS